jgi:hypothetical protein
MCIVKFSVGAWEQQSDCAYYCLRSDGHRNVFAGASRHGLVDLWDKRNAKEPVQVASIFLYLNAKGFLTSRLTCLKIVRTQNSCQSWHCRRIEIKIGGEVSIKYLISACVLL